MKTHLLIMTAFYLLSAPLRTHAGPIIINPDHASFQENEFLKADEENITQWIRDLKQKMIHGYMLNQESAFAAATKKLGAELSDDERNKLIYRVEVRPIEKLKGVYIALFWDPISMTKSLLRSDLYAHGGQGVCKGTVATGSELFFQESLCACRGLNLAGKDLFNFFSADSKKSEEETVFQNKVLNPLFQKFPKGEGLTVISVSLRIFSLDTLGHEILHAYWNQFKEFRNIVKTFWEHHVSIEDKMEISKRLGFIYGENEPDVLINEFQAYLLQPRVPAGQSDFLSDFRPKYERQLADFLSWSHLLPELSKSSCSGILAKLSKSD